jgi:hypothetical protein
VFGENFLQIIKPGMLSKPGINDCVFAKRGKSFYEKGKNEPDGINLCEWINHRIIL